MASPYLKELPMYTAKDQLFVRKSHQTQQRGNQEVSFQMWKDLQEVWSLGIISDLSMYHLSKDLIIPLGGAKECRQTCK